MAEILDNIHTNDSSGGQNGGEEVEGNRENAIHEYASLGHDVTYRRS